MFRPMKITPVTNGFIVDCGCMTLVTTSLDELVATIERYYRTPAGAQELEQHFAAMQLHVPGVGEERLAHEQSAAQMYATREQGRQGTAPPLPVNVNVAATPNIRPIPIR